MRAAVHLGIYGCVVAGVASARAESLGARELDSSVRTRDGARFARQLVPAIGGSAVAQSRTIYLNRGGVTLRPGGNDARRDQSSLITEQVRIPAWDASPKLWGATVACVQTMFAPFDVSVTDEDPGDVPHVEAVFAATPQQVGLPAGIGGVSPFTSDCGVIENSVVFTFTSLFPADAQVLCEVMAQEIAHSYGLDHELLASDPMTYLEFSGKRAFQDQTMPCGELEARPCGIAGVECRPAQNSFQLLRERLGESDGTGDEPIGAEDDEAGPLGCRAVPGPGAAGLALALVALIRPLVRRSRR